MANTIRNTINGRFEITRSDLRRIFDQKEIENIIYKYTIKLEGSSKIAKNFNTSTDIIKRILIKNNIKIRSLQQTANIKRIKCDENYFSNLDREDNVYYLGLLMADGNIADTKWTKRMSISLQERDKDILKTFKEKIKYKGSLYFCKKYTETCQNQYELMITSEKLCQDLINLNCVPRKSLILKYPPKDRIPTHLEHHFIRGYFDGDGCITHSPKYGRNGKIGSVPTFRTDMAGTLEFLTECKNVILRHINIDIKIRQQGKIYRLWISGNNNVRTFGEFLYKDAAIFLKRKKDKFDYVNKCKIIVTSKYKHVHYRTNDLKRNNLKKKWMSTIRFDGKTRYVGTFFTEFEAYIGLCKYEEKNKLPFSNDTKDYYSLISLKPLGDT